MTTSTTAHPKIVSRDDGIRAGQDLLTRDNALPRWRDALNLDAKSLRLDRRTFLSTVAASTALAVPAFAAQSPEAATGRQSGPHDTRWRKPAMSDGGLSRTRLGRMHEVMAGFVERGEIPGLVTLVCRRGEVHVDAIGMTSIGGRDPMRRDTIFRVASMTKPVAAAAAMILVEECKLRLDEPVDRLLPELAGRKVLKRLDGPLDDTVAAKRPITLRDLLTFRTGFGILMAPPGTYPIQKAIDKQVLGQGPPRPSIPPRPMNGSRGWGRSRSCANRESAGCTTRAPKCSAC
jgi:CubicO group peptidase (beta-lactamase class C family)